MTPERALNRLAFRFQHWKVNEDDVKALNSLIGYVNHKNSITLQNNDLFAKLFIEKFITLASTERRTASSCVNNIEEILNTPVYELVLKLKECVPMIRFNNVGMDSIPFDEGKSLNLTYIRDRNNKIADLYEKELLKSLLTEYTEEEAIDFVETQVNRLIRKHNN